MQQHPNQQRKQEKIIIMKKKHTHTQQTHKNCMPNLFSVWKVLLQISHHNVLRNKIGNAEFKREKTRKSHRRIHTRPFAHSIQPIEKH